MLAVVAAQLVEQSLPTPEVHNLNPISDMIEQFSTKCEQVMLNRKDKEFGNAIDLK